MAANFEKYSMSLLEKMYRVAYAFNKNEHILVVKSHIFSSESFLLTIKVYMIHEKSALSCSTSHKTLMYLKNLTDAHPRCFGILTGFSF